MNILDCFPLGLTGLISLAVQGTLKSLLQHHSSKASVFPHSAFFMVQPLHLFTGKAIALTIRTFDSKVTSLLFNMLSKFVKAFLPKSKPLLISGLLSPSSHFGAQDNKICHRFYFSPSICPEVMGPVAMILVFLNNEFQASLLTLLFHPQEAL